MWESKYKCFVIGSRYVCTKDDDLAKVYSSVKKAVRYLYIDDDFGALLRNIIDGLEIFARHRGLLDKSRYIDVRKTLTLGYDTYNLSDDEFTAVRNRLIECIYNLQELEELADKISPLGDAEDDTRGYDPKKNYRELRIRATHVTRDMSVANTYNEDYYVGIDSFDNGEKTICLDSLDGGCVKLISVTEDAVTVKWNGKEFVVKLGTHVSTEECLIDNPHLSSDSLTLTFSYSMIPNYAELWNMIVSLGCDELDKKEERWILTNRKKKILHFIDKAIEKGNTGLYVAKALLSIYNNWGTCEIDCIECFQKALLKGIDCGCLAPDNYFGWEWMEVASKYNDPTYFMNDMELYYEVLYAAVEHGVVEAIDIMNTIWEPEQIIEED